VVPSANPTVAPSVSWAVIVTTSSGSRGWCTASANSDGSFSTVQLRSPGIQGQIIQSAYSLVPSTKALLYSTGAVARLSELNTEYSIYGSVSLGDWNDIVDAAGVSGITNLVTHLGISANNDGPMVTNSGALNMGNRYYFISWFVGGAVPQLLILLHFSVFYTRRL